MTKQNRQTDEKIPGGIIPKRWCIQIQRVPTNNEEVNSDKMKEVVFCSLDDIDMLILQQNQVMGELLEDSFFSEELDEIRYKYTQESWGRQTKKPPKGFKEGC